jgi:GT2 family glycosyltransferase
MNTQTSAELSVIIPCRGMAEALAALLCDLEAQEEVGAGFEVLVIDDGTDPPLSPAMRGAFPLRVLRLDGVGPAAARNAGAREARGAFLLFLDADVRVPPKLLKAYLAAGRFGNGRGAWSGPVLHETAPSAPWSARRLAATSFVRLAREEASCELVWAPSCNLLLAKAEFAAVGGFDARFSGAGGEDIAFAQALRCHGVALTWVPGAAVRHREDSCASDILRRCARYGRGEARLAALGYVQRRWNLALVVHGLQGAFLVSTAIAAAVVPLTAIPGAFLAVVVLAWRHAWAREACSLSYQWGFLREAGWSGVFGAADLGDIIGRDTMRAAQRNEAIRGTVWSALLLESCLCLIVRGVFP